MTAEELYQRLNQTYKPNFPDNYEQKREAINLLSTFLNYEKKEVSLEEKCEYLIAKIKIIATKQDDIKQKLYDLIKTKYWE
jgi:hypothetical protein